MQANGVCAMVTTTLNLYPGLNKGGGQGAVGRGDGGTTEDQEGGLPAGDKV